MFDEKELDGLADSLKQYRGLKSKIKDFLGPKTYTEVMEKMEVYKKLKKDERHEDAAEYLAKLKKGYGG